MRSDSETVSRAIIEWTGWGSASWPSRDDSMLTTTFGEEIAAEVKSLEADFYASGARLHLADLQTMGDTAEAEFQSKHPEISDEAVRALGWCYTFDYK